MNLSKAKMLTAGLAASAALTGLGHETVEAKVRKALTDKEIGQLVINRANNKRTLPYYFGALVVKGRSHTGGEDGSFAHGSEINRTGGEGYASGRQNTCEQVDQPIAIDRYTKSSPAAENLRTKRTAYVSLSYETPGAPLQAVVHTFNERTMRLVPGDKTNGDEASLLGRVYFEQGTVGPDLSRPVEVVQSGRNTFTNPLDFASIGSSRECAK
jgi:hypothetical protein